MTAWNDAGTPPTLMLTSSSPTVVVTAASRPGESYWASISWAKICAGSQIPFYWNLDTTGKLNSTQRKLVAIHEFGHIQGLAHVTRTCSQTPAVMVQGKNKWDCGWAGTAPWLDDRNGVHAEY